ncbi:MAG: type II secretion system minor pseudopilin GspK [Pseudomonadota bacterium]
MRYRHSKKCRQRGAALVVALLIFALCAALVIAMASEFNRYYQRGANILLSEQASAYLRGAEELATLALKTDYDAQDPDNPRDDLMEIWAQTPPPYALDEGGWMMGCLQDLQGRFNLNALAERVNRNDEEQQDGQPRYTPAQAQFIRLLQALGEPQVSEQQARQITESVTDWLDPDMEPAFEGAEDDFYFGLSPGYRTANRPMASVSELRAVAGMSPEIYLALEPFVTVWPQTPAPMNIHTAPATLLRSINEDKDLNPLSESEGVALMEQQRPPGPGFADMDDFLNSAVLAGKQEQMEATKNLLGESSDYFLLSAEVEVADRRMRLYSVLQRTGPQIKAIARGPGVTSVGLAPPGDENTCTITPSLDW